jgi:hypothetical protein
MYPSQEARELAILLRIARELDICGDTTAVVDNPSELLAWATILTDPTMTAWRAQDSGGRYLQVSADHRHPPVRGHVSAVLACEQHPQFWNALHLGDLRAGDTRTLTRHDLTQAWEAMPVTAPEDHTTPGPPTPGED